MAENIDIGVDDAQAWADKSNTAITAATNLITVRHLDGTYESTSLWDDIQGDGPIDILSGDVVTVYSGSYTATQRSGTDGFSSVDNVSIVGVGNPVITCTMAGSTAKAGFLFNKCNNIYLKGLTLRTIVNSFVGGTEGYCLYIGNNDGVGGNVSGNVVEDCLISETWNVVADGSEMIVSIYADDVTYRNCKFSAFDLAAGNLVKFFSTHDGDDIYLDNCTLVGSPDIQLGTGGANKNPAMASCHSNGTLTGPIVSTIGYEEGLAAVPIADHATVQEVWFPRPFVFKESLVQGVNAAFPPNNSGATAFSMPDGITTTLVCEINGRMGSPSQLEVRVPLFWDSAGIGDVSVKALVYSYPLDGGARVTSGSITTYNTANGAGNTMSYIDITLSPINSYRDVDKLYLIIQREAWQALDTFAETAYFGTPLYSWVNP